MTRSGPASDAEDFGASCLAGACLTFAAALRLALGGRIRGARSRRGRDRLPFRSRECHDQRRQPLAALRPWD